MMNMTSKCPAADDFIGPTPNSPYDRATMAMECLRQQRGELARIARAIGISKQAVHQWLLVPVDRVDAVAEVTGIKPEELRPDWFLPLP
jgi:hypothetical protein